MSFIAAGEILGATARVRTLTIARHPMLPDGGYAMVDAYCTDLACDCRKTMILVHLDHRDVTTINFGWEARSSTRAGTAHRSTVARWPRCRAHPSI